MEMVGADRVVNAVALNSVVVHTSRIVGPALAGVVIALVGVAPCFARQRAVVRRDARRAAADGPARAAHAADPAPRATRGQLRLALALRRARRRRCGSRSAMMALVGTLSFNFQVLLPLLARFTWHGTPTTYAVLTAAMGVGSVAGALAAGRARPRRRRACWSARPRALRRRRAAGRRGADAAARSSLALVAARRRVSVTFAAGVNSSLQLAVEPAMRGRVMALYSVVFLGSTPIGAPLVGWLAEVAGPARRPRARRDRRAGDAASAPGSPSHAPTWPVSAPPSPCAAEGRRHASRPARAAASA